MPPTGVQPYTHHVDFIPVVRTSSSSVPAIASYSLPRNVAMTPKLHLFTGYSFLYFTGYLACTYQAHM